MSYMRSLPVISQSPARAIRAELVVDGAHYRNLVATRIASAEVSVWIATANLKTMLVEAPVGTRARARGKYVSFFETLSDLGARGVDVRILHASPPSRHLVRELAKIPGDRLKLRACPRVHLKMIAIDGRLLYLGSANLTGAGLGAKGDTRRNFEMGILTDDDAMLDTAQARFDRIWRGRDCVGCGLRRECASPLDVTSPESSRRMRRSPSAPQ